MTVFTCDYNWEAMLSCIYTAWTSRLGFQNIRLALEENVQRDLFDTYIYVPCDVANAESVIDAVNIKISPAFYSELAYAGMAYEPEALDTIYRVMVLGFAYGPQVLDMVQYEPIIRFKEISRRLGNESCRFKEAVRFHEVRKDLFVAHIEPKSKICITLGPPFEDRMPSENWMIVDDVNKEAVIHPKNEHFYLRILTSQELEALQETERLNDEYTDLWKVFFDSISIKERENYRCQRNHSPLWARKHIVEFNIPHK